MVIAEEEDVPASQQRPAGVIMDLVQGGPLAEKPNATSVLRCRWAEGRTHPLRFVLSVGATVAGALQHLHAHGIMHGDVYAHNVVATPDGASATLLDFGASFVYDRGDAGVDFERLEVRALGLFLADLLARCPEATNAVDVAAMAGRCLDPRVAARPTFGEVARALREALRKQGAGGVEEG